MGKKIFKYFFLTVASLCMISLIMGHTEQILGVFIGGVCYLMNR